MLYLQVVYRLLVATGSEPAVYTLLLSHGKRFQKPCLKFENCRLYQTKFFNVRFLLQPIPLLDVWLSWHFVPRYSLRDSHVVSGSPAV